METTKSPPSHKPEFLNRINALCSVKHHIVYKNEKAYSSFPLLDHVDDDNIYIGFFRAPTVDHFGIHEWVVMKSVDGGETWYYPLDEDKRSKFTYGITSKKGYVTPRGISDRYVWGRNAFGSAGFRKRNGKVMMSPCMNLITTRGNEFIYPAGVKGIIAFPRPLHTKKYIFMPAYGVLGNKREKCFIFRISTEDLSWKLIPMFPDNVSANEMALVQVDDGTILALVRSDREDHMLASWSEDHGLTWTYPILSSIKGGPPHLLKLKDGSILCSYGYRFDPMGIEVRISRERNRIKWGDQIILRCDGGYPSSLHKRGFLGRRLVKDGWSDVGYPVSIQLGDGSILTAYYITGKDRVTHIAVTKWDIK